MKINNLFRLNWTSTARLNYRAGGWRCVLRMPIKVYGPLRLHLSGRIELPEHAIRNTLIIGSRHEDYTASAGRAEVNVQGVWRIQGIVRIGPDCFIGVAPGALLEIGDGCAIGRDSQIHCAHHICFGRDVFAGELYATDSTEHQLVKQGVPQPMLGEIIVGDGVYIGFRAMLLRAVVPAHSVVASGSVVNKDFSKQGEELLLAGVPAIVKGRATYALKNVSTR